MGAVGAVGGGRLSEGLGDGRGKAGEGGLRGTRLGGG